MRISDWSSYVCSSDLHHRVDRDRLGIRRSGVHASAHVWVERQPQGLQQQFAVAGLRSGYLFETQIAVLQRRIRTTRKYDAPVRGNGYGHGLDRSEEHTSELQSLMRISYAVFCVQNKN